MAIRRLYVRPGWQGQGIGSQLLGHALAGVPGARRYTLEVAEGNPRGLAFWTKQGFRICGREEVRIEDVPLMLIAMQRP